MVSNNLPQGSDRPRRGIPALVRGEFHTLPIPQVGLFPQGAPYPRYQLRPVAGYTVIHQREEDGQFTPISIEYVPVNMVGPSVQAIHTPWTDEAQRLFRAAMRRSHEVAPLVSPELEWLPPRRGKEWSRAIDDAIRDIRRAAA